MGKEKAVKKDVATNNKKVLGRSRSRRNSMERKCLSKEFKRLFAGSSRSVFLLAIAADKEFKNKARKA